LMMLLMAEPLTLDVPVVKVNPVVGTLNWVKLWKRLPFDTVPVPAVYFGFGSTIGGNLGIS